MKYYRITDEAESWWIEYRTDGMKDSISEKIVSYETSNADPLELNEEQIQLGLPNHLGQATSQLELTTLCIAKELRLTKQYDQLAEESLRKSSGKEFLTFTVPGQVGDSVIVDGLSGSVDIGVTAATDISALIPTFTITNKSKVTYPDEEIDPVVSGVTEIDFTAAILLKVWDEAETDKDWEVTIVNLSDAALITAFDVPGQNGDEVIADETDSIALNVDYGTDVSALTPVVAISEGAVVSPASAVEQDFTNPVTYTVTSEDETVEKEFEVTITVLPNTATDILTFSLAEQIGTVVIDDELHTIAIEVANGTVVTGLVATFTLSPQATAAVGVTPQVSAATANDFTNPVVYAVTAGDETTTQNWTVTVTEAAP